MQPTPKLIFPLADRIERISSSATGAVLVEAERLRAAGVDVVNFGVGEPDFPTPDHIKQAAVRAIERNLTKYTPTPGIGPLREAVCHWHKREFGTDYRPAESVITVGGKHAIFNALNVLVNEGEEVILPAPYWVSYPDIIRFVGAEPRIVQTSASDGFRLRAAHVEAAIGPKTRALLVNSPNNPSGAVVPPDEFERLLGLCRRHGIWLITDECYSHFLYGGLEPFSVAALDGAKDQVIVAGSCSKTFAMTGWRIGFALGPKPVIDAMIKLQGQSTANPTSIAQYAAIEAFTGPMDAVERMLVEYARRRAAALEELAKIPGVTCAKPEGAFYVFPDVGGSARLRALREKNEAADTGRIAAEMLSEARVATVAGEAFGAPGHLRISYAIAPERVREGIGRMREFLSE
ncbi:MAG TPA: pyridoxal phosphate-dependent aminotransferase [Patescibacteria group bacterium]|nr:pyridoxal phosphate-dependent aminotransferase [Patescibacteria group bacterium]